ncbi:hypothetical protein A2526_04060 [candidate division WOR-1 bacterium RIFOXYD2_FULL_36_8]|uniref:Uncharacterized protein n=1 Tax=candidate division WOR-1 bacterium RIFOXYB2_FULL_36_35 TaxID=1802578 RepID=A0A1F4S668_UNCSA|nr:MAG: hypothetical protein A2230_01300 [candidate division WOR-1 bacterium RIFOXYA2_FULL_36_21]OGC14389.1 MAG: hypothetical protein A2282_08055 [candidate division WOR-1 bacterium RIFOXYA12_FULL_36_13]OGC15935.1 MAG: hypothetical protein A2290_06770 [candidate division WOR-1 bacterium RIFOXYB2_FULL_36_35]OGC39742.1 MAG: hypothetical protein A2526_04060 [candidate division WOR-1 bacterium RIFOXYD2_FULL_36_8]
MNFFRTVEKRVYASPKINRALDRVGPFIKKTPVDRLLFALRGYGYRTGLAREISKLQREFGLNPSFSMVIKHLYHVEGLPTREDMIFYLDLINDISRDRTSGFETHLPLKICDSLIFEAVKVAVVFIRYGIPRKNTVEILNSICMREQAHRDVENDRRLPYGSSFGIMPDVLSNSKFKGHFAGNLRKIKKYRSLEKEYEKSRNIFELLRFSVDAARNNDYTPDEFAELVKRLLHFDNSGEGLYFIPLPALLKAKIPAPKIVAFLYNLDRGSYIHHKEWIPTVKGLDLLVPNVFSYWGDLNACVVFGGIRPLQLATRRSSFRIDTLRQSKEKLAKEAAFRLLPLVLEREQDLRCIIIGFTIVTLKYFIDPMEGFLLLEDDLAQNRASSFEELVNNLEEGVVFPTGYNYGDLEGLFESQFFKKPRRPEEFLTITEILDKLNRSK